MLLGCIADDLTGATDLGVTLAREGLSVIQVNGVPEPALEIPASRCDRRRAEIAHQPSRRGSGVVACFSFLVKKARRRAHLLQVLLDLRLDRARQHRPGGATRCSMRLASASPSPRPAYPRNGRTVYKGNLFVGDVPLAESGMRDHPLTPMRDSNLVRVLGAQTQRRVSLVPVEVMEAGAVEITKKLSGAEGYAVLDATRDEHLIAAGEACRELKLTTGGAGLAMGLARALGVKRSSSTALPRLPGPAVILAGSCSQATLAQIEAWGTAALKLDPLHLDAAAAVEWAARPPANPCAHLCLCPAASDRGRAR